MQNGETVLCFVSVPVTAFRVPRAREYWETLPVPPPATVYGMLLSAVGEENRLAQQGAELAIAMLAGEASGRVLRTLWRVKDKQQPSGSGENRRPDFQEIITAVRLAVHVRPGEAEKAPALASRLAQALADPASVTRFGGLALGESTSLVDELRPLRPSDARDAPAARWLVLAPDGPLPLPLWVDHVGSKGTRYGQFSTQPLGSVWNPPPDAWVAIRPQERGEGRQTWGRRPNLS